MYPAVLLIIFRLEVLSIENCICLAFFISMALFVFSFYLPLHCSVRNNTQTYVPIIGLLVAASQLPRTASLYCKELS